MGDRGRLADPTRVILPSVPEVSPYQPLRIGNPRTYAASSIDVSLVCRYAWYRLATLPRARSLCFKHTDSEQQGRAAG